MPEKLFRPDPQNKPARRRPLEDRIMKLFTFKQTIVLQDIHAAVNTVTPEAVKVCLNNLVGRGRLTRLLQKGKILYVRADQELNHV